MSHNRSYQFKMQKKHLPQIVEIIRERFDLYYVGVFLVDQNNQRR